MFNAELNFTLSLPRLVRGGPIAVDERLLPVGNIEGTMIKEIDSAIDTLANMRTGWVDRRDAALALGQTVAACLEARSQCRSRGISKRCYSGTEWQWTGRCAPFCLSEQQQQW
jgi:hypothetical protein